MKYSSLILVLSLSLTIVACGGKKSGNNSGGIAGVAQPQLNNSYFVEFMNTYATPADELPPFVQKQVEEKETAITQSQQVVFVTKLFSDGRAEVFGQGYTRIESGLSPAQNGTNGLYRTKLALVGTTIGTVDKVFANGLIKFVANSTSTIEANAVAQKLGNYRGYLALTRSNKMVIIENVFVNGQAEVYYQGNNSIEHDLIPAKDGANGLFNGHTAITSDGKLVSVENVFADGRARIYSDGIYSIAAGLTPTQ
jgi:hypothetical protein